MRNAHMWLHFVCVCVPAGVYLCVYYFRVLGRVCVYVRARARVCVCVCVCVCVRARVRAHSRVCVNVHLCLYVYARACMNRMGGGGRWEGGRFWWERRSPIGYRSLQNGRWDVHESIRSLSCILPVSCMAEGASVG